MSDNEKTVTRRDAATGEFVTEPAAAVEAPPPAPVRRASLVAGVQPWDYKITVDGVGLYCKEMSDELRDYVEGGFVAELAAALGCPLETMQDATAQRTFIAEDTTGARLKQIARLQLAHDNRVISECLHDWDDADHPCAAFKLKVPRTVKTYMVQRMVAACLFGRGDADFLPDF